MNPEDKNDLQPPKTPDEIMAAKKYLGGAFAAAARRIDALNTRLREHPGVEVPADNMTANTREIVALAARQVAAGTPTGDEILGHVIRHWQMDGRLPSFLQRDTGFR